MLSREEIVSALAELKRRSSHAINTYSPTSLPTHNQLSFHQSSHRYRLLFGGNQSGKSHAAAYEIACWARGKHPYRQLPAKATSGDITIWVISVEYAVIYEGIYRHLKNIIPDWDIIKEGAKLPTTDLPQFIKVRRPGGTATITFKSSKEGKHQKFQAAGVALVSIDEEIDGEIWEELQARTLATGGEFIISATLVESQEWITKLEDRGLDGDPQVFLTRLETPDNPYIDALTVVELKKQWSKETQEYRLYGRSRRGTGLIYEFSTSDHVIAPFIIPGDWPRYRGIDPGISVCAVIWIAAAPDGHVYAYREAYFEGEHLSTIAKSIKTSEKWILNRHESQLLKHYVWDETEESEHIHASAIDDKRNSRLITGDPGVMDQLYLKYGISTVPANKEWRAGIELCRWWLEAHDDGKPRFRIFRHLDNFKHEIRHYRLRPLSKKKDKDDPLEKPIKKQDHLMDAWRYAMMLNPHYEDRTERKTAPVRRPRKREFVNEFLGTEF